MKVVTCIKCNEEYAIDLEKQDEWYCPYCENLYSVSTDKLSVEKLQEQLNTAKKALTEISKDVEYFYTPDKSVFLPSGVAQIASDALAALEGGEDV